MQTSLNFNRWLAWMLGLGVLTAAAIVLFSFLGNPPISPSALWSGSELARDLFVHARLPRVLLAVFVGAGLASSGVAFQSLLRNPLADPYILGVSGGAALGGVLALALKLPFALISLLAFGFALGSLLLIYFVARVEGRLPAHSLLLTGVIFNAFAFALILLINSLVSLGEAHQILFLLMGSLEPPPLGQVAWVGCFTLIGLIILTAQASKMNVISLGDESAAQLGVSATTHRKVIFFAASVMVGASVATVGLIGFVGLVVPHMVRMRFGADHRVLLPLSAVGGGLFLL
ncbi:MAG: iron ABC transporter permease, partial [Deltaproteobacteria bacterium]|nr:iron ABC transporter permease [Deltaproteobacteria bacterium]